jgi:glycosyltransferase involved in cell wall biosynthesis
VPKAVILTVAGEPEMEPEASEAAPGLLVLDTSYTLEMVRERRLEAPILCRDLDGFFEHVWSVHPFATLLTSEEWGPRFGKPSSYELAPRHSVIEGKVGRFAALRKLFAINFLIGQAGLFFALRRLIRARNIKVIRAGSPLYVGLFGWALARSCGIPLVIRVGGNFDKIFEATGVPLEPRMMRSRRIEKMVERFVFRRADLVGGANQDNLDFALANGATPEKSTLFRYGNLIDERHLAEPAGRPKGEALLAELGVTPGAFLLYIGRFEPVKQPDHVIETLADVRRRGFDVKAVLAGDGRMRSALADQARALGVEEAVVFAGNVGQDHLAELIPLAAVVVSPHTGRALTEAALGAAPVAAYDIDWQAELIEDGVTGILVPHGEQEKMTEAVARLLSDRDRARRLGNALRQRALTMLDPAKLDEHERQEYRKLLARHEEGGARS